jgi:hypothetical protein
VWELGQHNASIGTINSTGGAQSYQKIESAFINDASLMLFFGRKAIQQLLAGSQCQVSEMIAGFLPK